MARGAPQTPGSTGVQGGARRGQETRLSAAAQPPRPVRRDLSQHFLRDARAIRRVADAAAPTAALAVEIGAGDGALTAALAARYPRVRAWEIDERLIPALGRRLSGSAGVEIVADDALAAPAPPEPFDVVANVPYGATAEVVRWCLAAGSLRTATLLTQLEYARKRSGHGGRWSRLTILTWPEVSWALRGRVARGAFRPVPRVDGGVLVLRRRGRGLLPAGELAVYRALVELGFTGAGGSLAASLACEFPRRAVDRALAAAGVPPGALVPAASPPQWLALHRALLPTTPRPAPAPARRPPSRRGR